MRTDPLHASHRTQDVPASLARWRVLTREANAAFARADCAAAKPVYERALRVAERLLAAPEFLLAPDDCLAALVVAHHNLSDLYRHVGETPAAIVHLCLPHEALLDFAGASGASTGVRLCAMRHLGKTRLALLDWRRQYGPCTRIDALLTRGTASSWPSPVGARLH